MISASDPILKNEFVQDAMRLACSKMLRRQLGKKFGRLPKWAGERLAVASTGEIEHWSTEILSADSLEGVLGKQAIEH